VEATGSIAVMLDLTRKLAEGLPLQEALQAVTDAALRLLPASHASVRVFDDGGTELLSAARSGAGSDHPPGHFQRGEGVAGWVVDHGKAARIDEASEDHRFKAISGQGFAIRSLLAVPLWSSAEVLGVVALTSPEPAAFNSEAEALASLLANCAVPAIERARLEQLANTDHLTLAFNHRYLSPRLEEELARARRHGLPVSLLLMDLDRFKEINDSHGHAVGDEALRTFARCVRESVRCHDITVRRGGDEFVLIMPHADEAQASVTAERIRARVSRAAIEVEGGAQIGIGLSIGLAAFDGVESAAALEQRADKAMYQAKREGGGRLVVSVPAAAAPSETNS